jgi:hypothetical protein
MITDENRWCFRCNRPTREAAATVGEPLRSRACTCPDGEVAYRPLPRSVWARFGEALGASCLAVLVFAFAAAVLVVWIVVGMWVEGGFR